LPALRADAETGDAEPGWSPLWAKSDTGDAEPGRSSLRANIETGDAPPCRSPVWAGAATAGPSAEDVSPAGVGSVSVATEPVAVNGAPTPTLSSGDVTTLPSAGGCPVAASPAVALTGGSVAGAAPLSGRARAATRPTSEPGAASSAPRRPPASFSEAGEGTGVVVAGGAAADAGTGPTPARSARTASNFPAPRAALRPSFGDDPASDAGGGTGEEVGTARGGIMQRLL
jgi:hypothetical protein